MPPIDSVLNVWAHINNCAISIDTFFNNNGAIGLKFNNCEYCYDVILYITSDGGHSWPGGNQTSNGDPVSGQIDATDIIWDFFKFKTLNCSTNNAQGSNSNNTIQIFPNPTNNLLNIYCKNETELLRINIYNSLGDLLQTIIGENQIDVSNFASGFYYISVATNKNIFQSKFIKTN
jgi:polyhydroxybutyrate depolymerase